MDGISELPCPHKRRLVRIRRPNTQDMEDLMVQQAGQVYLTTPYRQPPENDFCSKVDCLYCHRLRMQKLLKPSPWPRGDHLTPRHTHYHAPVLPIIKQGRCLIKRRSLKTPRSRRKATVIHLPPLTGETMTVHRAKGGGLPWWATKTPLGGISWVNADVTEPSTATDGIKLSAVANGEVLHLEEIRLEETKGGEGTEREEGIEEGEDRLEALKENVLPDISDESSVRSQDTVVSKDTGIGTATAFSEEVTLPSLANIKVFRLKGQSDDGTDETTSEETASFKDGMEDDNRGDDSEITEELRGSDVAEIEKQTTIDEPDESYLENTSKQHPHEMDGELLCTKDGCSCPYNKDSPQKQSPETSSSTDLHLAHIVQNADHGTADESAASRSNGDDFDGKKNELDSEESDLDREGCSNSDEEREAEDSHSPLKENDVRRGDTPQFFDISKRAWLHDRPPQSPPRTPPPPRRIRTPVRIVRTPSNVSAKAGSGEPSTVEMSPPPSPPPEEDIAVEEEEEEEEGNWQEQIEVSVQMKEPEPPPPSPTPEPPEEPELAWDEEEKQEEEPPKPPSPPPTPREPTPPPREPTPPPRERTPPPREPTPPPREPTPPPREPTPPPREPTPPPREPTPPPREPTPPPEPEKEPTPPPSPPPVEKPPTPPPPSPTPEVEEEPVEVAPPLVEEEPPPPSPSPELVAEEPPPEVEEPPNMEEETEPELEPEPEPEVEPVEVREVKIEEVEVVEPRTPEPTTEKSDEEMEETAVEAPPEEGDGKKGRKKSAKGKKKKKRKAPPKVEKTPIPPALLMDPSEILNMEMKMRRKNLLENKAENDAIVAEVQEFEVKRPKQQAWLQGRLALSRQISRFELPMDMRLLEGMSPIEYLSNYCIVSKRRQNLYKQSFTKADRDRDGIINVKELDKALKQIHVDGVTTEQVQKILDVIQATDDTKFDAKLFTAVCALAERMLYTYFVTEDTDDIMYSQKERVEDADFCALEWKLHGVKVNPPIRKLLQML